MGKWQLSCTCGDKFEVEANSKEEAVDNLSKQMTPEMMMAHMQEKHAGEPMPSPEQAREALLASAVELTS